MARVVELVWLDVRESKSLSRRNDIQESDQDGEGRNCSLIIFYYMKMIVGDSCLA